MSSWTPRMSFAMESAMSGYSQKMLLKLKVLMHKEQFCDVEIIVQVQDQDDQKFKTQC